MKIGILTLPLHTNYGGILQAYALQTVLERMGNEVVVIDRKRTVKTTWKRDMISYPYRLFQRYIRGKRQQKIRWEVAYRKKQTIETSLINRFINRNINVFHIEDLCDIQDGDFDAIVVGSDQIWRKPYYCATISPNIATAYLNFTKGWRLVRIAYSASFGVDNWEYSEEETKVCAEAIKFFDAVSVREESGVNLCKKYLQKDAAWTLDPTLLLSAQDYISLIHNKTENVDSKRKELFVYILDKSVEKQNLVNRIAKQKGLEISDFQIKSYNSEEIKPCKPVEEWLDGILRADFIVTDSFHACVFSIIMHKPFIAIINKERGASRFETLSSKFGVSENIIVETKLYDDKKSYEIDNIVYEKLEILRKISIKYLEENLYK